MPRDKFEKLCYHIRRGNLVEVQTLVNESKMNINRKDSAGRTPLVLAAAIKKKEMVDLLIRCGADINSCDDNKWTIFHYASKWGWDTTVQSLVNKKMDINLKDSSGDTPLMVASYARHKEIVRLLIETESEIHLCDHDKWTVLHYAAKWGWEDIILCLVNKKIDVNQKDSSGDTPLLIASYMGYEDIVRLLIICGADIHCRGSYERTLLHIASYKGWMEMVQELLKEGADIRARDSRGFTPLHPAAIQNRGEMAEYLLRAGADCNLAHALGESALSIFMRKGRLDLIRLSIEMGGYVEKFGYENWLQQPAVKTDILQDVNFCSQALINKFNKKDLPALYEVAADRLPSIDRLKMRKGSAMALEVEQAVTEEIQMKGYCNVLEACPLVLCMLTVNSLNDYINTIKQDE